MPEHRHLPHLRPFDRYPVVFITTVTLNRRACLACQEAHDILRALWRESLVRDGWAVSRYVLMPDHVHLFARSSSDAKSLARWVQSWKSISARRLGESVGTVGTIWQADYFDRFVRSSESYSEKWAYVAGNPVRKGFVSSPSEWPWQGTIHELRY